MNHQSSNICLLLCLMAGLSGSASAVDIVLRQKVTPVKTVILLGDIADVQNADFAVCQQLRLTPLWVAPPVGEKRFVSARQVFDLLVSRGYEAHDIHVSGAKKISIGWDKQIPTTRPVQRQNSQLADATLTASNRPSTGFRTGIQQPSPSITRAQRYQLAAKAAAQEEQINQQVAIAVTRYLETQTGLHGFVDVELKLPKRYAELLATRTGELTILGGRSPWIGRQTLKLDFMTSAGPLQLSLPVASYDLTPVLIAKRPIRRGQLLTAADVAIEAPHRDTRIPTGQTKIYQLEDALGKEASRAYREGDVVTAESCLPPMMVERNAVVDIIASGGGIVVRRQGKAMADARMGDVIEAELLDGSRERLVGRVVGNGQLATLGTNLSAPHPVPGQGTAGYR